MESKPDIFDRIMSCKAFRFGRPFYAVHKEVLLYLFFGGLTTLISILSFAVVYDLLLLNEHLANIISWVLAVSFAFITNRTWVFKNNSGTEALFFSQMTSFFAGRLFTLFVEEIIVFVFISKLGFTALFVKVVAQFVVLVLNYLVSKFWVFKNG